MVQRIGGLNDGMRRGGRQCQQTINDGEEHQGATLEVDPQNLGFSGGPTDTSLLTRYQDHNARHLWFGEVS